MKEDKTSNGGPCYFKYSFKKLREYSSLSSVQLRVLLEKPVIKRQIAIYPEKKISKGAYYRIKKQAIKNVTKAIMTLSILSSCDIISSTDISRIITTISSLINEEIPIEDLYSRVESYLRNNI